MKKNAHASAAPDLKKMLASCANIAWYPSCGKDYSVFDVFTPENLGELGVPYGDAPDCVIMTDFANFVFEDFEKHLEYGGSAEPLELKRDGNFTVTLFNLRRLRRLNLPIYDDMASSDCCGRYYGNVYTGDVLTESSSGEKHICRLVAVCAENAAFAFEYLIPKKISIGFVIRKNAYGFCGGASYGRYLPYILRDLGARYFVNDAEWKNLEEVAYRLLSNEQRAFEPELRELGDLTKRFGFYSDYGGAILYRVEGYNTININTEERKMKYEPAFTGDEILTPAQTIDRIFERTSRDSFAVLPALSGFETVYEKVKMSWTEKDKDALISEAEKILSVIRELALNGVSSDPDAEEIKRLYLDVPHTAPDADGFTAVVPEEAEKRLGKGVRPWDAVTFAQRYYKLIQLEAPKILLDNDAHSFARALAVFRFAQSVETIDNLNKI